MVAILAKAQFLELAQSPIYLFFFFQGFTNRGLARKVKTSLTCFCNGAKRYFALVGHVISG